MLFKTSNKIFIHLDCDSFFASCEVLKNPALKNKYVCVGKEIVIACTYNCKALGVKTGTPVWQAKKMLKNRGLFLSIDHQYYEEISQKIFAYLKPYVLTLEPFSIDEAFCEITGLPEYYEMDIEDYIYMIQKKILQDIGIPVSIWCAQTRIKAKIYSKINKPFWIYIGFDTQEEKELFEKLEFGKIPFIWRKSQEKLKYKIKTIADLLHLWFWEVKKYLWKSGTDLWLELMWVNAFHLRKSDSEVKSISRSRSFNKTITNDKTFLLSQLHIHFERVFEDIIEKNLEIKTLSIMLRTKEFQTFYFTYHFPTFTCDRTLLHSVAVRLLEKSYDNSLLYRSVGIVFLDFKSFLPRQMNIFEAPLRNKEQNFELYKTIAGINKKIGTHKISFGTTLLWAGDDTKLYLVK